MGISEKVSYLKGLMEGMNLSADSNEGKLFRAIVDVLDEIALEVEDLTDEVMELGDGLDVISDDLGDVEDIIYDEDDDDDAYYSCDDDFDDDDFDDDDDETLYETVCPSCNNVIALSESILEKGEMPCPCCGEMLEFDYSDLDGDGNSDLQMSFDQDGEYVTYVWYWNTVRGEFMDTLAD